MSPWNERRSYEERLRRLKLPTVTYRCNRSDMIETHKIIQGIYDTEVTLKLPMACEKSITKTRGHEHKMFKTMACTNIISIWNRLPTNIVNAPSLNSFKARLPRDRHWQDREVLTNYRASIVNNTNASGSGIDVDIEV